jgi:amino acid adenylation domain-containing protein
MELSADRRALLELLVRGNSRPIQAAAAESSVVVKPASYAQRRLWLLEQIHPDQNPYTLHTVRQLTWKVDPTLLQRALDEIVLRHDILRTTFSVENGEPVQQIPPAAFNYHRFEDLRDLPETLRHETAIQRMSTIVARRFDLEHGPLLRTALYCLDENQWILLLAVHHIIFDGPSFNILFSELESVYGALSSGRTPSLTSPAVQYGDFAQAQRDALTPERVADELEFWRSELANLPMLDLPLSRPRSVMQNANGALRRFSISADLTLQLRKRATDQGVTLFTVLLAGAAATLSRLCGQDDFAIGLPVAGRDSAQLNKAIGFFVDTMVVRCGLRDNPTTNEIVDRIRDSLHRSLAHRALPFDLLVEHLRPVRDLEINPLFQVGFQLIQNADEIDEPGPFGIPRSEAMFDLGLDLWTRDQRLEARLEYKSDIFDTATIELFVTTFQRTLEGFTDPQLHLNDLDWSCTDETSLSIIEGEVQKLEHDSFWQLLLKVAESNPAAVALEGPDLRFTYQELVEVVSRLAGALRLRGVQAGSLVLLAMPRSVELVIMQLAVLRARAAFIPLDMNWPEMRRQSIVDAARPVLIVDLEMAVEQINQTTEAGTPEDLPDRDDAAYIIFTSGSTGTPKGVVLEHAGLLNVALAQRELFGLSPGRRVAQLASPSFDASVFELTLALGSGATLVVPPPDLLVGDELADFLESCEVDTVVLPPTLLASMQSADCSTLRLILVAGESCPVDLAKRWGEEREFWNLYGPTEATIWATFGRGEAGTRVPIGRPIPNITTLVVDAGLRPVPVGVAGELCLAGVGLARAYLNNPELTSEKFVHTPLLSSRRMYRTSDLVRQLPGGDLVFLGRTDRQSKIHGFRIEPEEIEVTLRKHPLVADCVVAIQADVENGSLLVAYLQSSEDKPQLVEECRQLLRQTLPPYMIPNHFIFVRDFPRTSSGKIDHLALPRPEEIPRDTYVEPTTETERRVAELMARATRLGRVGATDNFFAIGGHSLAAAELTRNINAVFKVNMTLREIFLNPTVSAMSALIDRMKQTEVPPEDFEVPLVRLPRKHENPTSVQQ